jgi:hypothetical protein
LSVICLFLFNVAFKQPSRHKTTFSLKRLLQFWLYVCNLCRSCGKSKPHEFNHQKLNAMSSRVPNTMFRIYSYPFYGQTGSIVVRYRATKNSLLWSNRFCFRGNIFYVNLRY